MPKDIKILVVIPTRGILYTEAQEALERELTTLNQYPMVLRTSDIPLPHSRNVLLESAMAQDWWTHLLMLDDDIVMPEGSLEKLIEAAYSGTDVAVIDYPHHRHDVLEPEREFFGVATYEQWMDGDTTEDRKIAWAGLGCVLARRKALEKMLKAEKELFKGTEHYVYRNKEGKLLLEAPRPGSEEKQFSTGEDVHFYFLCRKHDIKVRVIPNLIAAHLRMDKFVYRLAGGKYRTTHRIARNDRIDVPANAQYVIEDI